MTTTTTITNTITTNTTNVDTQEISNFADMVATWWDKEHGSFRFIHKLNPLRTQYVVQQCSQLPHIKYLAGKRVLDLGCGAGILSESLAREGAFVTGLDMTEVAIKAAQSHAQHQGYTNIQYQYLAAETLATQQPEYFDVICCMEMVEHVPDYSSILQAAHTMLKPQGLLVMSTINRTAKAQLEIIEAAENYLQCLPRGTHQFHKFITPGELIATARKLGFKVVDVSGYKYHFGTDSFYLDKDPEVNYLISFVKIA